jgi:uncharacterized protein
METPQEVQVWYILPALRKHLAINLKKEGLKQKDIASALSITEAAVSQYVKEKRGDMITFGKAMQKEINASAKKIAKEKGKARFEIQRLMSKIKESRFMCNVCQEHASAPSDCDICYIR